MVHVRVCRECGEEYRPQAVRCADCGGTLEDRQLDESGEPIPTEPDAVDEEPAEPLVEHRVVFVTPRAADVVPLAEALREAEVLYRLAEQPPTSEGVATRYALLVREEDAAAALRVLGPLLGSDAALGDDVQARFEPGRGYLHCPACGAESPPGTIECTECGLGLGAADESGAACTRCGAPLSEPGAKCPGCGSTPAG